LQNIELGKKKQSKHVSSFSAEKNPGLKHEGSTGQLIGGASAYIGAAGDAAGNLFRKARERIEGYTRDRKFAAQSNNRLDIFK